MEQQLLVKPNDSMSRDKTSLLERVGLPEPDQDSSLTVDECIAVGALRCCWVTA